MNRFIFICAIIILKCLLSNYLGAQNADSSTNKLASGNARIENAKNLFLQFGFGGSLFNVRDKSTSPLIYSGSMVSGNIGLYYFSDRSYYSIDECFSYGNLGTRNYPEIENSRADSYNNFFQVNFLWRLNHFKSKYYRYYLGTHLDLISNFRNNQKFNNANLNYEIMMGIGPSFCVYHQFQLRDLKNRTMAVTATLNIPLLIPVLRPQYNVVGDFVAGKHQVEISNTQLKFINKLFAPNLNLQMYYFLRNKNALKISYFWNFYRYDPGFNAVNAVNSTLTFSFLYRFNK